MLRAQGLPAPRVGALRARRLQRFLATPEGRGAYHDLVAGVAAAPCDDRVFDGFRTALRKAGVSASQILEAEESQAQGREPPGGKK